MTDYNWSERLPLWLAEEALPLWTSTGVDAATGTVWEALDHQGQPLAAMERRLRVQVRQAYCFAQSEDPEHRALALQLFRFAMDHGFDPETGNLGAMLAPDCRLLSAPHDLYDLAFMLLAAAALIEAGFEVAADLARLEAALARLKAPRGWFENLAPPARRRQNPHMHMFEASTALFAATGEARFRSMAEECLALYREVFLKADGQVLEYFDTDWRPLPAAEQAVEPGHMAEWIYLIDRYEVLLGSESDMGSGLDLAHLFQAVAQCRDASGLLPDRVEPATGTRRMWPQTELLKAAVVLRRRGLDLPPGCAPEQVLSLMWSDYLQVPVAGGWYDKRSETGALLSDNMPASTFYHILVAFRFYLSSCRSL
ncbi:Mannose-6-phosphate isomerase-like protein [Roseobacter sp. SK209-2-6]|uniref:AGE family epimerase/isomerase n=1 Tax=Roseobacter sp. SK209-2-6 TaxID=388739 RepID=UPI0000F3F229|nr:AGE family epimerase/isomerase [Roseobacter sp. SK209-2-6]EBA14558.1 Mannose-6-phosphate isomerase-like protein [Roseobacter sp. SK209-2-6]